MIVRSGSDDSASLDVQCTPGLCMKLHELLWVIRQTRAVAGDHALDLGTPCCSLRFETLGQHIQGHLHSSRSTGRSSQQAANRTIRGCHNFSAKLQHTNLVLIFLHDLHTLTSGGKCPILCFSIWHKNLQLCELMFLGGQELLGQVNCKVDILKASGRSWDKIVPLDRLDEVKQRAGLQ